MSCDWLHQRLNHILRRKPLYWCVCWAIQKMERFQWNISKFLSVREDLCARLLYAEQFPQRRSVFRTKKAGDHLHSQLLYKIWTIPSSIWLKQMSINWWRLQRSDLERCMQYRMQSPAFFQVAALSCKQICSAWALVMQPRYHVWWIVYYVLCACAPLSELGRVVSTPPHYVCLCVLLALLCEHRASLQEWYL